MAMQKKKQTNKQNKTKNSKKQQQNRSNIVLFDAEKSNVSGRKSFPFSRLACAHVGICLMCGQLM